MPDSNIDFRSMQPQEKAEYLLKQPCKVSSNNDPALWQKCLELAEIRAEMRRTADILAEAKEKAEREGLEKAVAAMVGTVNADISRYTVNGRFDAMQFITDKKSHKTTLDGHILSAGDVLIVREEMAKGTPKAEIHDIIKKHQRERMKKQTEKQVAMINARLGMINQPFCKFCMNRGYSAYAENGLFIALKICGCVLRREKAAEERRKAELEEKKNKKSGGKQNGKS